MLIIKLGYNQTPPLSTEILTNSEFCVGIEVTGGPAGPEGPDKMTVAPYNKTDQTMFKASDHRNKARASHIYFWKVIISKTSA